MWRQLRFLLCCAAALLVFQTHKDGVVFYLAGTTAFANLFSAQMMCGAQSCQVPQTGYFNRDPIALFHYATTFAGAIFCLLGLFWLGVF